MGEFVTFLRGINPRAVIENRISEGFGLDIPVYVISRNRLNEIIKNDPTWWDTGDKDKYDNLILLQDSPEELYELIGATSEGLEVIQTYEDVIFWTFERSKYQKCNWWKKTASVGIKDKITIRTANTVKKLCG